MPKVLFCGNRMAGDDGVALAVLDMLKDELAGVQMQESTGADIADITEKEIIIVDAFKGKPGEVTEIGIKDISRKKKMTAHDIGAAEGILLLKTLRPDTTLRIIGIGIKGIRGYGGISRDIKSKLPGIKRKVAAKIKETGCATQYQQE